MNKEQLLGLRQQITSTLSSLVLDNDGVPEDRVEFLMNIVRLGNADQALYQKTFEVINALQDVTQKTSLLFELLSEVESDIEIIDENVDPQQESDPELKPIEPQTEDHDPQPEQHEQYNEEHHDQQ